VLLQVAGGVAVEHWLDEARDLQFAAKLHQLRCRLNEAPGSPLVLMLGSSRTCMGFQAGAVQVSANGKPVVIYNFGASAGGALTELLFLRRLLAKGIRPQVLLVEALPALFNRAGRHSLEETWLQGGRLRWAELARLERYHADRARVVRHWWLARLMPWSSMHEPVQEWLGADDVQLRLSAAVGRPDGHGWETNFPGGVTEEQHRHYLEVARSQYQDSMQEFHLVPEPIRALQSLVELCRLQQIEMAVVLMPEGPSFQALYPPDVRTGTVTALQQLTQQWQVPLIDARNWLTEADFWDGHHPLAAGAAQITCRLTQEAIIPLLRKLEPRDGAFETVPKNGWPLSPLTAQVLHDEKPVD
jgi:hypothetical protein